MIIYYPTVVMLLTLTAHMAMLVCARDFHVSEYTTVGMLDALQKLSGIGNAVL